jgi:hypothetical protein
VKVKDLKPFERNPRKITEKKLDMLGKSMREFGDLSGIVFNLRTGRLVGGHQRIKQLDPEWEFQKKDLKDDTGTIAEGFVVTPKGRWTYREVDWPEEKERAANIAANKHGADFDIPAVKNLITGMEDIEITGFTNQELFFEPLVYEEKEIRPYSMTHILLSFPPQKLIEIQKHLEEIAKIAEVEIEQGSNG